MSDKKSASTTVHDPGLYRKLSEPVPDLETASQLGTEFYDEVAKLREKYHVPNVVMAFSINYIGADGVENVHRLVAIRGNPPSSDGLILELVKGTRFGAALATMVDEFAIAIYSR